MRQRKTDYGTIILHWLFVGAFAVALVSGLRIAAETPDRTWINMLDVVLPRASVWTLHMQAAVVLVAVALGYAVYLVRSGLVRRVQLDKVRLRGLFGRGQARLGALIALMYWIFFVTMVMLLVSGGLLYFGLYSNYDMAMLHWVGTWVILAFVVLHILTQYKSGGLSQLLRIFRPAPLPAPPPRLDTAELLAPPGRAVGAPRPGVCDEFLPEAPSHPLQPRADARRERAPEANPARRPARPCKIAKSDAAGQCVRGGGCRGDHRRFVHRGDGSVRGRSPADCAHQCQRRADPRRRHVGPGLARRQAVLAPDRRRREFRRQGRNPDRGSRGA